VSRSIDPDTFLRLPARRRGRGARRRRPSRFRPPWLVLGAGLVVAVVLGLPRLAASLASMMPAAHRPTTVPDGWEYLGFANREVRLVAAHRRDPVVYCVLDDTLAVSRDLGRTWELRALPAGAATVTALAVATDEPSLLLLGTQSGYLYRSEDSGLTWRTVHAGDEARRPAVSWAGFDPHRPRVACFTRAGNDGGGLWRSTDHGQTWHQLASGPHLGAAFYPQDSQVLYTAIPGRVGRSTDAGKTWGYLDAAGVRKVLPASGQPSRIYLLLEGRLLVLSGWGSRAERVSLPEGAASVIVHPADPALLWAGAVTPGEGVWRSEDGGQSWTRFSAGLGTVSVRGLALGLDGHALYAATSAGLWRYSPAGPGGGGPP